MVTFSNFPSAVFFHAAGACLVAALITPAVAVAQTAAPANESERWIDPIEAGDAEPGDTEPNADAAEAADEEEPRESDRTAKSDAKRADSARKQEQARLHHAPPSVGRAHEPLLLRGVIEYPQLAKRIIVAFRTQGSETFQEVEFKRAKRGPYVAVIPAEDVRWPYVEYTVEIEAKDGSRRTVFASRDLPFRVEVPEDIGDMRERAILERLGGKRSTVTATSEYVSFGRTEVIDKSGGTPKTTQIDDSYYRVEGSYTYRPARIVTEFGLRAGVVRAKAPSPDNEQLEVGLNYGAPHVQFRLVDVVHLNVEFLTSVTETGFSLGGGSALVLGDPLGSRLTMGFESIQNFGSRFYSRMDMEATETLSFAPIVEITDMPNATKYGVRLLGEATIDIGDGASLALRGGYQARDFTSGGPSGGAALGYSF